MSQNEIQALVSLLVDDDPNIRDTVVKRLVELGAPAREALEAATDHPDARLRARARALLRRLAADDVGDDLSALLASEDPDLEEAALLLAQVEYPDLDPDPVHADLDRLGERVAALVTPEMAGPEIAQALGTLLHDEEKFHGNVDAYYDPRNSYINDVLERRLGIPISLSAVYILAGRRAGLDLVGVGMPMHFLVALRQGDASHLIDPYGGGRLLTREACKALLAGYRHSFREDYLRPVSDRDMLRRMMANLVHIYHERGDRERLSRLYAFVNALQGRT